MGSVGNGVQNSYTTWDEGGGGGGGHLTMRQVLPV